MHRHSVCLSTSEQLKPSLNVNICWIQFRSTLISIQGISDLIVARFILSMQSVISQTKFDKANLPKCQGRTRPRICTD